MKDTAIEVAKITPPATVAVMTMQDWAMLATLVYTLLVIFDKFYPGVLPKAGQTVWAWIKGVFRRVKGY